MSNWQYSTLGEILPFKYGKGLPERKRSGTGEFNVVSSAGITGTHNTALTSEPCVVIGRKGTIGSLHFCPGPVWPIDTTFYVTGSEQIEIRYAYYLLHTLPLATMNNDSAIPGLNRSHAESIKVCIPSIAEQRRIIDVLGALDDKIESNRQVCSLIDLLATELFCDRFTVYTRGETSDLMTIGDIGEIVGGGTPSKKVEEYYADSGIAWLTPRDLSKDRSIFRQHGELDISELGLRKSSARLLPRGTVLFTSRAPIGYIAIASGETSTNQGFKSIVPHSSFGTPFTFYLLKQLTPEIVTSANGSTFKEISKSGLAKVSFKSPSTEAVEAFNATVQPLLDLQEVKEIENCQLSQLRDTLLPELMSGRMRVDKAGCLVSEALDEEVADV